MVEDQKKLGILFLIAGAVMAGAAITARAARPPTPPEGGVPVEGEKPEGKLTINVNVK